jgi:hypothetical protein
MQQGRNCNQHAKPNDYPDEETILLAETPRDFIEIPAALPTIGPGHVAPEIGDW